jgi:uncharacterized protein (DUF1810 family)
MTVTPDPHELDRFVQAQRGVYERALAELRQGRKLSHWMWFIFPQFAGLGRSSTAELYAIQSRAEAQAYLAHPLLGPRLIACMEALLAVEGLTASQIFGYPDDLKLRSCATLFAQIAGPQSAFTQVLDRYYGGQADEQTLRLLTASDRGS